MHMLPTVIAVVQDTLQVGLRAAIPLPKTVCLPFSHDVMTVVMKNWEPLVLGPALAMLSKPATSCFSVKFSSCRAASGIKEHRSAGQQFVRENNTA